MRERNTLAYVLPEFRIRKPEDAESVVKKKTAEGVRLSRSIVQGRKLSSRYLVCGNLFCQCQAPETKRGQAKGAGMVGEDGPNDSHAHAAAGAGCFARTDQKRDGRAEAVDVYGKDVHQLNETPFEGSKGSEG